MSSIYETARRYAILLNKHLKSVAQRQNIGPRKQFLGNTFIEPFTSVLSFVFTTPLMIEV